MAKWSHLKGQYPKAPLDGDYQAKLEAVLDSPVYQGYDLKTRDLANVDLATWYDERRKRKDQLEEQLKVVELEIAAATQLFIQRFEDAGVEKMVFDGGLSLSLTVEPKPFVENQPALYEWVKKNDLESLLTLNYQTMAALTKDAILNGKLLPAGVNVYMQDRLTRRGSKKESE